jgi:hypothetical protein
LLRHLFIQIYNTSIKTINAKIITRRARPVRPRPTEGNKEIVLMPKRNKEEDVPTAAPVPNSKKKPMVARVPAMARLGFLSPVALEGGSGGGGCDTALAAG